MTTLEQSARQALDALEKSQPYVEASANKKLLSGWGAQLDRATDAVAALREALEAAQPIYPPTNADLEDIAKDPELYEDYAPGRTSLEYLSPVLFGRAVLARFWAAPQPPAKAPVEQNQSGWINPNNKSQKQFLPHIGEAILFKHDWRVYTGKHTGGSFKADFQLGKHFDTWDCLWMYPSVLDAQKSQAQAPQPLTDDKVYEAIKGIDSLDALQVWRAAEAAHGITQQG